MSQTLEYAKLYAGLGWKVFPIRAGGKEPIPSSRGVLDATGDLTQIEKWWGEHPDWSIAIACGQVSGVHVIDIDVSENADGWKTLASLAEENIFLPDTVRQDTPSGGAHFFYKSSNSPRNKNNFMRGVDIRSDGYYVVVAPSVHPNGRAYEWFVDSSPWEISPVEYPLHMRPAEPKEQPKPTNWEPPPICEEDDRIARAERYIDTCDPAIQGLGGHDSLMWAAGSVAVGFDLTNSQVLEILLRRYNSRCQPPWNMDDAGDSRDFRRKIGEARRTSKMYPGQLLSDPAYAPPTIIITDSQVAKIIANSHRNKKKTAESDQLTDSEYEFLISPPGMVGDFCSWLNSASKKYQPWLVLGAALSICGTMMGRKVKTYCGQRTNLYCVGIAGSSWGKNNAIGEMRKLSVAVPGLRKLIGGDDITSDAALESQLSQNPASMLLIDEIGHMLGNINKNGTSFSGKIIPFLMKVWSAANNSYSGKRYKSDEEQRYLTEPCLSMYGVGSNRTYEDCLSLSQVDDGWIGRTLIFKAKRDAEFIEKQDFEVPENIVRITEDWVARGSTETLDKPKPLSDIIISNQDGEFTDASPKPDTIATTEAAKVVFRSYREYIKTVETELTASLWGKACENAVRISLILASGNSILDRETGEWSHTEIDDGIADYACRLTKALIIDFLQKTITNIRADTARDKETKILHCVGKSGTEGVSKTCMRHAIRGSSSRERNQILSDLTEDGKIVIVELPRKMGKSKTIYYLPGNLPDEIRNSTDNLAVAKQGA